MIVVHNYPSGDPLPSPQDLGFTAKFVDVGRGLGVEVLDYLILASGGFVSFKQRELM